MDNQKNQGRYSFIVQGLIILFGAYLYFGEEVFNARMDDFPDSYFLVAMR